MEHCAESKEQNGFVGAELFCEGVRCLPSRVAAWELWPPTSAQHHERVPYCMSLTWGKKIQSQNSKYNFFLTERVSLLYHRKAKKS